MEGGNMKTGKELLILLEKQLLEDYNDGCPAEDALTKEWAEFPLCELSYGERDGCVNEASPVWKEDICLGIIEMLYSYYKVIKNQLEIDFDIFHIKSPEYIKLIVQPSYEDRSDIVLYLSEKQQIIFSYDIKAWNFYWENPAGLAQSLEEDYQLMTERLNKIFPKEEK
jgi:hypothetical protein